jgi:hypothetical protein
MRLKYPGQALNGSNCGQPCAELLRLDLSAPPTAIANHIGDGVNFLAGAPGKVGVDITANGIAKNFPFLPTPYDGKNRVHVDCGETGPGGNPCGPLVP